MRITTPRWTSGNGATRAVALEVLIHGPMSRSEVARRLDLSPGSLTPTASRARCSAVVQFETAQA